MSSLIEQAAQRLGQLRRTGVSIPEAATPETPSVAVESGAVSAAPVAETQKVQLPEAPARTSQQVTLDLDALNAANIITPNAPRSHTADQFRVIKRPLLVNAKGMGTTVLNHGNLIMVTSALVGEGKSFTSINLAMSIAMELDNTVMLVDADVARPSVLRMLGLPGGPGLLDLLEGKADMADVLLKNERRKADHPAQRNTSSAGDRAAGQRCDAAAARRHGATLPRPDHRLRLAAAAADHRGTGPGHPDGAGRLGGAMPTRRCRPMSSMRSPRSRPVRTSIWCSTRRAAIPPASMVVVTATGMATVTGMDTVARSNRRDRRHPIPARQLLR